MNSNEYVFYVFYFHHHSDNEDLQKFRLVVASDIEEIADYACRKGPLITTDTWPHVIPVAVVLKMFVFC